ncbi:MAG TPA: putative glycolipid-binding domain-containing protein [Blastocatellia bacterium]|nr:putative glycolipid-binding domain-containing protein [Blastocatellia bacterium]
MRSRFIPVFCWLTTVAVVISASNNHREVMWASLDERVFEHVRLIETMDGVQADGLIIHRDQEGSVRLRYRVRCDTSWRVNKVQVTRLDGSDYELVLNSDGSGHWTDKKGDRLNSLDGCLDIDIYYSPFTNTIAIRRLALKQGGSAETKVAFIGVPDLTVTGVQQRYTFLKTTPEGSLYRYEGLSSGFSTELPVDHDGLVIQYPKFFRRVWAT